MKKKNALFDMKFSFYKKPIKNLRPYRDITLLELYKVVRGDYYKVRTELLRKATPERYKEVKATELDYITPGGTFHTRKESGIIKASGLISIDIDHISNPEEVKTKLSTFEGMQFIFTSPSGKGVKAILKDPMTEDTYSDQFEVIRSVIEKEYGYEVDSTPDISRACFLCHDPNVWISNEVKLMILEKKNPYITELKERFQLVAI
jgi:hypothetical protein